MIKVYIASSFKLIPQVKYVAKLLNDYGCLITKLWWNFDYKTIDLPNSLWYKEEDVINISQENFNAIDECDILLFVANHKPQKYNGANVEVGYAIGKNKIVCSIGELERSAMYVPIKQFVDVIGFLDWLQEYQQEVCKK